MTAIRNVLIGSGIVTLHASVGFVTWVNSQTESLSDEQMGSYSTRIKGIAKAALVTALFRDKPFKSHLKLVASLPADEYCRKQEKASLESPTFQYLSDALEKASEGSVTVFEYQGEKISGSSSQKRDVFNFSGTLPLVRHEAKQAIEDSRYVHCFNKLTGRDVMLTKTSENSTCEKFDNMLVRDLARRAIEQKKSLQQLRIYNCLGKRCEQISQSKLMQTLSLQKAILNDDFNAIQHFSSSSFYPSYRETGAIVINRNGYTNDDAKLTIIEIVEQHHIEREARMWGVRSANYYAQIDRRSMMKDRLKALSHCIKICFESNFRINFWIKEGEFDKKRVWSLTGIENLSRSEIEKVYSGEITMRFLPDPQVIQEEIYRLFTPDSPA